MLKSPWMFLMSLTSIIQGHLEVPGFLPKRALGVIIWLAVKDANFALRLSTEHTLLLVLHLYLGSWKG